MSCATTMSSDPFLDDEEVVSCEYFFAQTSRLELRRIGSNDLGMPYWIDPSTEVIVSIPNDHPVMIEWMKVLSKRYE